MTYFVLSIIVAAIWYAIALWKTPFEWPLALAGLILSIALLYAAFQAWKYKGWIYRKTIFSTFAHWATLITGLFMAAFMLFFFLYIAGANYIIPNKWIADYSLWIMAVGAGTALADVAGKGGG